MGNKSSAPRRPSEEDGGPHGPRSSPPWGGLGIGPPGTANSAGVGVGAQNTQRQHSAPARGENVTPSDAVTASEHGRAAPEGLNSTGAEVPEARGLVSNYPVITVFYRVITLYLPFELHEEGNGAFWQHYYPKLPLPEVTAGTYRVY
ncbi:hypothetical protein THAOC_02576 [Thalassiosira oceanica]|uniref:Uncharacterized protein n=1 Tax=Thalassiosira oceanica TaxID=159749 RepID=K0TLY1_THAOC|nr:hypothetical protein THAOC_02576 [Thalassiosira oceanica]|eukprot:EJK75696.1 hypothetical protein THAOC_02576 [Thalassiosira oceanica]